MKGRAPSQFGPARARTAPVAALLPALLAMVLVGSCDRHSSAQPAPFVQPPIAEDLAAFVGQLDQLMPTLLAGYGVPGAAVALVHRGAVAWASGYGLANREKGTPVTPDTVFALQSLSKPVTAWGVLRLAEQGTLDLDAPVEQYLTRWHLPASGFDSRQVTARRLLSHTAGIAPRPSSGPAGSLEGSLRGQAKHGAPAVLEREPGQFLYSDHGYAILQLLIEEITHERFADYMRRAVLTPLGVKPAGFTVDDTLRKAGAIGYDPTAAQPEGEAGGPIGTVVEQAAFGLHATAPAVARFLAATMRGPAGEPPGRGMLTPETIARMLTPAPGTDGANVTIGATAYGLGYGLMTLPGGVRLASHGGGSAGWKTLLALLPDKGEGLVVLTNGTRGSQVLHHVLCEWQAWAVPGGRRPACGELYDIYVIPADGSGLRRLTQDPASDLFPAWSPDGGQIAFTSTRDRNWNIFVMNADGSGERRLTTDPADDTFPAWSPDGRRIAFTSTRDGRGNLYVMNADGSGQTRLTTDPAEELRPAWSPDGARIAFARGAGADGGPPHTLWVMNADGSGQTRLTDDPADTIFSVWSPDGTRIAFIAGGDLYVMNAGGSGRSRLTDGQLQARGASWSADGTRIAFAGDRDGSVDIYIINADGSGLMRLTDGPANALLPAWSPDGALIAFASNRPR